MLCVWLPWLSSVCFVTPPPSLSFPLPRPLLSSLPSTRPLQATLDVVMNLQFHYIEKLWQTFWCSTPPSSDSSTAVSNRSERKAAPLTRTLSRLSPDSLHLCVARSPHPSPPMQVFTLSDLLLLSVSQRRGSRECHPQGEAGGSVQVRTGQVMDEELRPRSVPGPGGNPHPGRAASCSQSVPHFHSTPVMRLFNRHAQIFMSRAADLCKKTPHC